MITDKISTSKSKSQMISASFAHRNQDNIPDIELNDNLNGLSKQNLYTKNYSTHINQSENHNPMLNFTSSVVMTTSTLPLFMPEIDGTSKTNNVYYKHNEENTSINSFKETDKIGTLNAIKNPNSSSNLNYKRATNSQQILSYKSTPKTNHLHTTNHQFTEEKYSQRMFDTKVNKHNLILEFQHNRTNRTRFDFLSYKLNSGYKLHTC